MIAQLLSSLTAAVLVPLLFMNYSHYHSERYPTDLARLLVISKPDGVSNTSAVLMEAFSAMCLILMLLALIMDLNILARSGSFLCQALSFSANIPNQTVNVKLNQVGSDFRNCNEAPSIDGLLTASSKENILIPNANVTPLQQMYSDASSDRAHYAVLEKQIRDMSQAIIRLSDDIKPWRLSVSIAFVIVVLCLCGGTVSGSAFNIGRVFGPGKLYLHPVLILAGNCRKA